MMTDKNASKLCIISIILMFVVPVVALLIAGMFMNGDISGATAAAYGLMIPIDSASYIAAWVLAIIARTRYKSKFEFVGIML